MLRIAPSFRLANRSTRFSRRVGWIGADIGTTAIKLAQVARHGKHWKLLGSAVITTQDSKQNTSSPQIIRELSDELRYYFPKFRGSHSAFVLSNSVLDLQTMELPGGSDNELRTMIQHELGDDWNSGTSERIFDFWTSPQLSGDANRGNDDALLTSFVVSVDEDDAFQSAENLHQLGVVPQLLDSLPCCLARAVRLLDHNRSNVHAAVDWGMSNSTFVLVSNGHPIYARTLRDCSAYSLFEALSQRWSLSIRDCQQLLMHYDLEPQNTQDRRAGNLRQQFIKILSPFFRQIALEIEKTVQYLGQQDQSLRPEQIYLFGSGAMIKSVSNRLTEFAKLNISPWQLPLAQEMTDPLHALLGPAIALSALGVSQ